MSEPLQLIVESDGIVIWPQQAGPGGQAEPGRKTLSLGEQLAEYSVTRGEHGNTLLLFVSEDLLFYKSFVLPLNTQDLKEAISYQVGILVPFEEEDLLYSFTSERRKDGYFITLVATSRKRIESYLEEFAEADFHISGLYPAFQRYVTRNGPKDKWALVSAWTFGSLPALQPAPNRRTADHSRVRRNLKISPKSAGPGKSITCNHRLTAFIVMPDSC